MNPIFTRRYKGGGRPNIMPTTRRQTYQKGQNSTTPSQSSSSSSASSFSSGCNGVNDDDNVVPPLEDMPPGLSSDDGDALSSTAFSRSKAVNKRVEGNKLAQQLLASKQNMLAQLSLTPHENRQRAKANSGNFQHAPQIQQSVSIDNFSALSRGDRAGEMSRSPTLPEFRGESRIPSSKSDVHLCELEDIEDDVVKDTAVEHKPQEGMGVLPLGNSRLLRPNLNERICKEAMDVKQWRALKQVVCGSSSFHEGWHGQGFIFDTNIPCGIVQKNGGPCGVLAVVQSLLFKNLLFGSPLGVAKMTSISSTYSGLRDYLDGRDSTGEQVRQERLTCLVEALTEILWTCGHGVTPSSPHILKEGSVKVVFTEYYSEMPSVIHVVSGRLELQHFLQDNLYRFDCIALVYSAVLTRGISEVKDDMDFENCSLVGQHGYCSTELINLLCLGKAISNTFDNEIELDGKVLKGITSRAQVGLLSLFEHYNSIQVGVHLKSPLYPLWIVCSESHFSVLFSCDRSLCSENNNEDGPVRFDLFYYDGLARQDAIIRLSISRGTSTKQFALNSAADKPRQSSSRLCSVMPVGHGTDNDDDELTPPLEKCIRTKWPDVTVDWNGTEPIL